MLLIGGPDGYMDGPDGYMVTGPAGYMQCILCMAQPVLWFLVSALGTNWVFELIVTWLWLGLVSLGLVTKGLTIDDVLLEHNGLPHVLPLAVHLKLCWWWVAHRILVSASVPLGLNESLNLLGLVLGQA